MGKRPRCRCQDATAVAILARISDKEKQGQPSLEAQVRETRELLVEPNGWHVVAEYRVRHRGSDLSRDPVYMEMIRDARAGRFAKLCLHKFDRFARRAYDREVFEHILTRECAIELHAALEPYDLKTRAGKLTKKASAFISDIFLDNLAEETMKGMIQKVIAGGWVARAPFGYVNKREEIAHNKFRRWVEPHPEHAETVRLIFRLFAGGQYTLDGMAEYLNGRGYTWEKGLPWRRDRVHRLLTNPFYTGRVRWNGIEAQGVHEPLVDAETFEACRSVLREHDANRERRSQQVYALNRLLHFAELGCGAHAEYQAHADIRYYRSKVPGPDGSKIFLRADEVEDRLGGLLAELEIPAAVHPRIRREYRREIGELTAPQRSEGDRLRRRLAELEEESRGYVRLRAQAKITEEEFDQERARVAAAVATIRGELASIEQGGRRQLSDLELALSVCGHLTAWWSRSDAAHRKLLAHLLFKRVDVDNAGEIVGYRLATPFAYLVALKKGFSPPPEAGTFGTGRVWATWNARGWLDGHPRFSVCPSLGGDPPITSTRMASPSEQAPRPPGP